LYVHRSGRVTKKINSKVLFEVIEGHALVFIEAFLIGVGYLVDKTIDLVTKRFSNVGVTPFANEPFPTG
jgi:hypothetical protein